MLRFTHTQFGVCREQFWRNPQLWREQLKIVHKGA